MSARISPAQREPPPEALLRQEPLSAFCALRDASPRDETAYRAALGRVVTANRGMVHQQARVFARRHRIEVEDAAGYATEGLLRALRDFDPARGFTLGTYATHWIRHFLRRSLENEGAIVRVPTHARQTHAKLQRSRALFAADRGREPTVAELSEAADVPASTIMRDAAVSWSAASSLDQTIGEDGETFMDRVDADVDPADGRLEQIEREAMAHRLLARLPAREREVIALRFAIGSTDGEPMLLAEIGASRAVTKERVRQIEASGLARIREHLAKGGHHAE